MKITYHTINENSWVNDTWLSPYSGYPAKLIVTDSKQKLLLLDDSVYNVTGSYTAPNGWSYTIEKVLSKGTKKEFIS